MTDPDRPRLRRVEAFPLEAEGRKMICLRDAEGYVDDVLMISPAAMFILALCDGSRTLEDVRAEFRGTFGQDLDAGELSALLGRMDEQHLLEGPAFERFRERTERAFLDRDHRPSAFAGKVFPETANELSAHLEGMILELPEATDAPSDRGPMRAAIAPHIDFMRGGESYATMYRALRAEARGDLFVILGTVHAATSQIFTGTRKHFETPLGRMPTATDLVDRLSRRFGGDLFEDEYAHRSEHSIEFQTVFLRHVMRGRDVEILPILCGSFHEFVQAGRSPADAPVVQDFLGALGEVLGEEERDVFFLAGADLSHVGPKFGDPDPPTPESCKALEVDDRRSLEFALRGDAEGFYRSVQEEGDRRKICGLSPIYTMLRLIESADGRLLHYDQADDPTMPGVVSYASVAYYR